MRTQYFSDIHVCGIAGTVVSYCDCKDYILAYEYCAFNINIFGDCQIDNIHCGNVRYACIIIGFVGIVFCACYNNDIGNVTRRNNLSNDDELPPVILGQITNIPDAIINIIIAIPSTITNQFKMSIQHLSNVHVGSITRTIIPDSDCKDDSVTDGYNITFNINCLIDSQIDNVD